VLLAVSTAPSLDLSSTGTLMTPSRGHRPVDELGDWSGAAGGRLVVPNDSTKFKGCRCPSHLRREPRTPARGRSGIEA